LSAYNKVSEQSLDEKQHQQAAGEVRNSRQVSRAAADAVRILMKTSTQLSRCCWVRKSHRTVREISREAGDLSIISFADYSQRSASQVLQEKAYSW